MKNEIQVALTQLRNTKPVILCLTNHVTMDFMANSLLALGASPIMSSCDSELECLINISHAVTINIGTFDSAFITRCMQAIELCRRYNKPIILDPVGAGASLSRTEHARALMGSANIIRGNASEIMALMNTLIHTAGVETTQSTQAAKQSASTLATELNCTVAVSGPEDYITNGQQESSLTFGSEIMPLITGMGCTLTAVIAAFRAVIQEPFHAARLATAYFGLCGQLAEYKTTLPGSFRTEFINELYKADFETMTHRIF